MLRRLRLKFVALNMITIALVLAVVFTAICVLEHQQAEHDVYTELDNSVERSISMDKDPRSGTMPPSDSEWKDTPAQSLSDDEATSGGAPFEIGGKKQNSRFIPTATYKEAEDGTLTAIADATTASIEGDTLQEAVKELSDRDDSRGTLDGLGLYYVKRTEGDIVFLAFADKSSAAGWQTLALTLAGVGVIALLAFLVINIFFSRWAIRPVRRSWLQQKRFVADASHELKTPLTVILANTSILLEHPERSIASQSQWVESTQTEAERMQQLVGDLLLLAQLDEGKTSPAHESVDLTDLVERDLLQFESIAFERDIRLLSRINREIIVQGDPARLHRLVATLIDNACKYADEGGEVQVTLRQTSNRIELLVHNTGPAITSEALPHIFDRFYRADKARTHDDESYGLGLAIAAAVVEEHGGTLSVESTERQGTTFTAVLP